MEKNFVLNGNKLIAEFLGLIKTNIEEEDIWSTVEYLLDNPESTLPCAIPVDITPYFHKSWDALMPVVEKISKLPSIGDKTHPTELNVGMYSNIISKLKDLSGIETVYKAVIEFITWYNENK